jgi:hypothetical protein
VLINIPSELKQAFNPNNGQGGRYIDYVVTWGVTNQQAQENAKPTANESIISRIDQITQKGETPLNVATFEGDGFLLDGSVLVPPKQSEVPSAQIGLIFNALSDASGNFINPQVLQIDFDYYFDWVALTINFGLVTAENFVITYYADAQVLHITTVTGNTQTEYADESAIEGCNKVTISISKIIGANMRARFASVVFGTVRRYNKSNSESLELTEQIDVLNERTPVNEMILDVENFAKEYNLFDPSGIFEYLRTRQKFEVKIGAQKADNVIEYVDMGKY